MKVKTYLVRPGDTLSKIAKALGITLKQLLAENPQVTNPDKIRSGELILVPQTDAAPVLHQTLADADDDGERPSWMKVAGREVGVLEVKGPGNNPRILEYHASTDLDRKLASLDATSWCSSFVNWCFEQSGMSGTNSAWALNWKDWGEELAEPLLGCVVVFSRVNGKKKGGHVGFYVSETPSRIRVLGGNQSSRVCEASYPKNGKLGDFYYTHVAYRWPKGA